ncbi:quinon protein alcohol dehydrogenase-like superfamily, partial [Phlyctochytrium arcticum]
LNWIFGFNCDIPGGVISLSDSSRKAVFYASTNAGVIYDYESHKQQLLQGHCNQVEALSVSPDKRFLVTADQGKDSIIIIWDSQTGAKFGKDASPSTESTPVSSMAGSVVLPIKTIYEPHNGSGIRAVQFTSDCRHLITLGCDSPQTLAIWDWTTEQELPVATIVLEGELQTSLQCNPENPTEFVSTGNAAVYFYVWSPTDKKIYQHEPILSSKDFKHSPSSFRSSAFLPTTSPDAIGQAISCTGDGDIIVWTDRSLNNLSIQMERGKKAAMKQHSRSALTAARRLHNGPINALTIIQDKWLVTGGEDGFVRVFDLQFRLVVWYERLRAGAILSVVAAPTAMQSSAAIDIPDLIVATKHCQIYRIPGSDPSLTGGQVYELPSVGSPSRSQQILAGHYGSVRGLAVHPRDTQFAIGGVNGWIYVWDYLTRKQLGTRRFEEKQEDTNILSKKSEAINAGLEILQISTLHYSPDGATLVAGFTNGTVRLLKPSTMEDLPQTGLANRRIGNPGYSASKQAITHVAFSEDSKWIAIADEGFAVGLFSKDAQEHWTFVGRCRGHSKAIVGLFFFPALGDLKFPRLVSVSEDQHMAEYDLEGASIRSGIPIKVTRRIEQTFIPRSAIRYPSPPARGPNDQPQPFFLTINSGGKFRLYNGDSGMCRQTIIAPTYGGDIKKLAIVEAKEMVENTEELTRYIAYVAHEKRSKRAYQVLGLVKLPLDGNPHKSMGVIAHPGPISHVIPTSSGSHLFSLGKNDGNLKLWSMSPNVLRAQIALGGEGLAPFLDLFSGDVGERDAFVREMEDYFYYAQLRSQGEDAMRNRQISTTVDLNEVPSIMQAMGYYLSFQETEDMLNEIRYLGWLDGFPSNLRDSVNFEELIKLYINHRPLKEATVQDFEKCLAHAKRLEPGCSMQSSDQPFQLPKDMDIKKEGLMALLQQYGETFSAENFDEAFMNLLRDESAYEGEFPSKLTSNEFVDSILGLRPLDPNAA